MSNNEEKNSVASALRVFGWIIICSGFIGGLVIANPSSYLGYGYDGIFLWPVAFGVWFGSAFSGVLALGFAEVLDYLKDISHTLKSRSTNKGVINEPVDQVALSNEKIYAEAKRMMSYSNGKAQLIQIEEKLVPIKDYKDVNEILVTIGKRIELIDKEAKHKEEKDLELRGLEGKRKQKQNMFWKKHSRMVFIFILILISVTAGLFVLRNINSEDINIIETWSGEWMVDSRSFQKVGLILNIKEEEVSLCLDSVCGEPNKVKFNDFGMDKISFKLYGIEHRLFLMSKNNASYLKDGISYDVIRTKK